MFVSSFVLIMFDDLRVCSRDSCKPKNINSASSVKCSSCNSTCHLLCYGIDKSASDIFIQANIVFLCDSCLTSGSFVPSPKRKLATNGASNNVINSAIGSSPSKSASHAAPASLHNLQASIDEVLAIIKTNTITLDKIGSKSSTVNTSTSVFSRSAPIKKSYANVLSENMPESNESVTSKSSGVHHVSKARMQMQMNPPAVTGTSSAVIGKPLTPRQPPRRSIWISRLHRETTEAEVSDYIKSIMATTSEFVVRKLVKKDREISSYSFVSFRITCSLELFDTLMDAKNWPSSVIIREFENSRSGVNLGSFLTTARNSPGAISRSDSLEVSTFDSSIKRGSKNSSNLPLTAEWSEVIKY